MAIEKKRGNRMGEKPEKPAVKTIAAAPSTKGSATVMMKSAGLG
jgi:hypothetical protein